MSTTTARAHRTHSDLSLPRLYILRGAYLFMAVGLALVKWPLLRHAADLPLYEGITVCLLTAMSLLVFLGLRYPVKLIPVLLLETIWKLLWLSLVALPKAIGGDLDAAAATILINCSLVIVIIVAVPWRYAVRSYARVAGDPWRTRTTPDATVGSGV
ncbi:hypothetical protein [Microlunatus sp. Gsoil 973]|jgi:hypothetical protein|uniref:hypothetical protein n=1 Tax=Microlunatus sp. Gsoil 973 TaxID=2672569 RepID=UPI0012B4DD7A|nr:hypothetical protein [Microlunatus sp. Gsoil 973]QGN34414.1 hypothetical protein GJV80_18110 [Microlunatus sp. Gsoil 973]